MNDGRQRTERGFRVYLSDHDTLDGELQVVESSLAFEGAHVRIFQGRDEHLHLSVVDAVKVRDALSVFIAEAEAGELTEPAEYQS